MSSVGNSGGLYTTQQLVGGPRYNSKVKVGNWYEDMELEEIKGKDYDHKKQTDCLGVTSMEKTFKETKRRVPQTFSEDGLLHFGDHIMLSNKKTTGVLVMNKMDSVKNYDEAYGVTTTTKVVGPNARNIFVIERYEERDGFEGDNIHYGQKVKFRCNSHFHRRKLLLHSTHASPALHAPVSRNQEVCMILKDVYDCIWEIDHIDPKVRFEMYGEVVPANEPILIKHSNTNHYLASDAVPYKNQYGGEFEVNVKSFAQNKKTQNLALEKTGMITSDVPTRYQEDQNLWMICTAPDPSYSVPLDGDEEYTFEDLLRDIKKRLLERSSFGIRGLSRIFKIMDDNGNHQLDVDDFRWGLIDFGITITKDEAQQIIKYLDRDGNGTLDFDEFLRFLRGDLNDFRKRLIRQAYDKLDVNKDGLVKLDDIMKIYDVSQHPDVIDGKKTEKEVYIEFMDKWDTQDKDGIITIDEFFDYFRDVSASIDTDEYFEAMMKSAWKLE
jgi:Ca2+-binding EF-hand superfamily protein